MITERITDIDPDITDEIDHMTTIIGIKCPDGIVMSSDDWSEHVPIQSMIRYSVAMTCLMAYHNKKGTEAISVVLRTRLVDILTLGTSLMQRPTIVGYAKTYT